MIDILFHTQVEQKQRRKTDGELVDGPGSDAVV